MTGTDINNLNGIERVIRLFIGCSMIGSVMFSTIPFDYLILMPLIGIYPCMTAIVGWDPVYFFFGINRPKLENLIVDHYQAPGINVNLMRPRTI